MTRSFALRRRGASLPAVAAICGVSACAPMHAGSVHQRAGAVTACTTTVHAYAHARDVVDLDAYRALFAEDAVFRIGETALTGRAAIVEALRVRGAEVPTRHLAGSIVITQTGPQMAIGTSYALVLDAASGSAQPAPLDGDRLLAFVRYDDAFRLSGEACRFVSRTVQVEFERPSG